MGAALERRGPPNLIRWDVNSVCNLSCSHCCVGDKLRDDSIQDLTRDEFQSALKKVAASGVRAVHFLGGEPTVRKDFLDLLRLSNELGLTVSFNTNGIRQDQRYIDAIFEAKVSKVVVSLDGYDAASHDAIRGKGTFVKTVSFIHKLVARRSELASREPRIQIQAVLTASWASQARRMADLAASLRVDGLKINHLAEFGDALVNIDSLAVDPRTNFLALLDLLDSSIAYPNLKIEAPIKAQVIRYHREHNSIKIPVEPYSCPAMHDNIYVGPDGEVTPCQLAHAQGMSAGLPAKNIVKEEADALWNSEYFDRFANTVQNPDIEYLYKNQVPCNRCVFNGRGCEPCPLPGRKGFYPTNYMCLIAEGLCEKSYESGEFRPLSAEARDREIERILNANPPRPMPGFRRTISIRNATETSI